MNNKERINNKLIENIAKFLLKIENLNFFATKNNTISKINRNNRYLYQKILEIKNTELSQAKIYKLQNPTIIPKMPFKNPQKMNKKKAFQFLLPIQFPKKKQ